MSDSASDSAKGKVASNNAPFFVDNEIIVLTKTGVWLADGNEISHEPTRKLFSKSLVRDGNEFYLKIGRESKRIQVEDTPYFVQRIDGSEKSGYQVTLNDETVEKLDPKTLHYRPGRLTCKIKLSHSNQPGNSLSHLEGEEALFLHAPYFDLLRSLQEDHQSYFLVFGPSRIRLAKK